MSDGKSDNEEQTSAKPTKKRIVKRAKSPDAQASHEPVEESAQTESPKKRKVIKHIKPKSVKDSPPDADESLWLLQTTFIQQKESLSNMHRYLQKRTAIYTNPNLGDPKGRQQYQLDTEQYEKLMLLSNQIEKQLKHLSELQKEKFSLDASKDIIEVREKIENCKQAILALEEGIKPSKSTSEDTDPNARSVRKLQNDFSQHLELFDNIRSHLEKADKNQFAKLSQLRNHIQGIISGLTEGTPTTKDIKDCQNDILAFEKELKSTPYLVSHQKLIEKFADLRKNNTNVIEELLSLNPYIDQINNTNKNFLTTYLDLQAKTTRFSTVKEDEKSTEEILNLHRMLSRPDIQAVINRDYTRFHEQLKSITEQQTQAREGINTFFNLLNEIKSEDMKLLSQIQPPNEKYTQLIKNIQQLIQFLNKNENHFDVETVASLVKSLKERTETSRAPGPYTPLTLISKDFFISPETMVGKTKEDTLKEVHHAYQTLFTQLSQHADLFPALNHTISQSILYRTELDSLYRDFKSYWQQTNTSEELMSVPAGFPSSLQTTAKEKTIRFQNIANELEPMFNFWNTKTIADSSVIERYKSKFGELQQAYKEKLIAEQDYNNKVKEIQKNLHQKTHTTVEHAQREFKSSLQASLTLIESLENQAFTFHSLPQEVKPAFKSLFKQIETTINDLQFLVGEKIIETTQAQHIIDALRKQLKYFNANEAPSDPSFALLSLTDKLDTLFLPIDDSLSAQTLKEKADKLLEHAAKLTSQTLETKEKNLLEMVKRVKTHQRLEKQQQALKTKHDKFSNRLNALEPAIRPVDHQILRERMEYNQAEIAAKWAVYDERYKSANKFGSALDSLDQEQTQFDTDLSNAEKKLEIEDHDLSRMSASASVISPQQKLRNLISRAKRVQTAYQHVTLPNKPTSLEKATQEPNKLASLEQATQEPNKLASLEKATQDAIQLIATPDPTNEQLQEQYKTLQLHIHTCLTELKETIDKERKFLEYCLKAAKSIPERKGTVETKKLVEEIQRNLEKENQIYEGPEPSDDKKIELYTDIQKIFSTTIKRVQTTLPLAQKFVYVLQFLEDLAAELVAQAPKDESITIDFTKLSPAQYLLNKKWDDQKLDAQLEKVNPDLPKLASFYRKINTGYNTYLSGEKTKESPESYINRQVEKLKSYTVGYGVVATILEYFRLLWSKISGPKYHLHFFENDKVKERVEKLALPEPLEPMIREREEPQAQTPKPPRNVPR